MLTFLANQAFAQETATPTEKASEEISAAEQPSTGSSSALSSGGGSAPEFLVKAKTRIKDPLTLRDPFRMNQDKLLPAKRELKLAKDGSYSNIAPMGEIQLGDLKVVGILLGPDRRAIVRVGTGTYILKEGMKLGMEKAEIKAILPGGMVLVEKIKNVYNQDEYLETIIPLSRDKE